MELEEKRQMVLDGKFERTLENELDIPHDLGYFGEILIVTLGGKSTVVFADPRTTELKPVLSDWYDEVISCNSGTRIPWDSDERFVAHPNKWPAIVKKDGKFTMVGYRNRNDKGLAVPYNDNWYSSICAKSRIYENCGFAISVYDAAKDGKHVMLTEKCQEVDPGFGKKLLEAKQWKTRDEILENWIRKGCPCYHMTGFHFRGSDPKLIDNAEAERRIKISSFGKSFETMIFDVVDGNAALVFDSLSEYDME